MEVVGKGLIVFVLSGLGLNLLFGYSLSFVWEMINGIQVINHYPMFWIDGPDNLSLLQAVIRKITNFEFELDDWLMEDLWNFTVKEDLVLYYE